MKKWIAVVLAGTLLLLSACGVPAGSEDIEIDRRRWLAISWRAGCLRRRSIRPMTELRKFSMA